MWILPITTLNLTPNLKLKQLFSYHQSLTQTLLTYIKNTSIISLKAPKEHLYFSYLQQNHVKLHIFISLTVWPVWNIFISGFASVKMLVSFIYKLLLCQGI